MRRVNHWLRGLDGSAVLAFAMMAVALWCLSSLPS